VGKNHQLTNISPYEVCFEDDFPKYPRWDIYPFPWGKKNDSRKSAKLVPSRKLKKQQNPSQRSPGRLVDGE